jgi:peptidyl-prolyl cis-trans isomerase A (cyclophilin A)
VIGRRLALAVAFGCAGSAVLFHPLDPRMNTRAPETFRVHFQTSRGDFMVEAHRSWAPIGADRFYNLVQHHFFDGQRFFRVRAGAFAQFGVPGDPQLARAWRNATIADDPVRPSNERGTLAYAFTTAGTRATQIFINLRDNPQYDAEGFAPFGRVISGMDVVDALYSGYGEASGGGMRAGHQDALFAEGNAWLERHFPKLDSIVRARLFWHNARP